MIATIVAVLCLLAIAILAFWILNEENKSLITENNGVIGQWNRAVARKDEQIAELQEQLEVAESNVRLFRNESLNLSRERDELRAIGAKLETENKRLASNLTAWIEKYDKLQAKASELCEVLK
jgi:septal ring factor EnvC (AmiA/AmiB activator)